MKTINQINGFWSYHTTSYQPLLLLSSQVPLLLQAGNLPVRGDALAGGECDVPGGAVAFAEAALNAAVHQAGGGGAGLQVLQVYRGVLVKDNAWAGHKRLDLEYYNIL